MTAQPTLDEFMPKNPIMAGAWIGSLRYALTREDMMAAFRADTGNTWQPGKTTIDRMIDEATGADFDFLKAFAKWHNANVWGEEDGKPVDASDNPTLRPRGREPKTGPACPSNQYLNQKENKR